MRLLLGGRHNECALAAGVSKGLAGLSLEKLKGPPEVGAKVAGESPACSAARISASGSVRA